MADPVARDGPASEPTKVTIGYQSLWAAGGEVVEVLRHTNIFELNGIEAQYKTFTFGGPLAEAAVAGDIDNVFAADAPVLRAMARLPGSKILQRTHDARFGILVQPDFKGGLADLKGKKLSAPFATTTFPRSVKALERLGSSTVPGHDHHQPGYRRTDQCNAGEARRRGLYLGPDDGAPASQKLAKVLWSAPRGENIGMQGFSGKWLQANGNDAAVRFPEGVDYGDLVGVEPHGSGAPMVRRDIPPADGCSEDFN